MSSVQVFFGVFSEDQGIELVTFGTNARLTGMQFASPGETSVIE
jgi:hypothetical protein